MKINDNDELVINRCLKEKKSIHTFYTTYLIQVYTKNVL